MADVIDMDVEVWDRTMAVNLRGAMLVCKHAIPVMLSGGRGAIVNTSSLSGLLGEENHLAYACSKAALLAFTRHVANMHGAGGNPLQRGRAGAHARPTSRSNGSPNVI